MRLLLSIIVFMCFVITPVGAVPEEPDTASEALAQYNSFVKKANKANEDLQYAKTKLKEKERLLKEARQDLSRAAAKLNQARIDKQRHQADTDRVLIASLQGARFSRLQSLLTGDNPKSFLDHSSALEVLARNSRTTLNKMTAAIELTKSAKDDASDARADAKKAKSDAKALVDKIKETKADFVKKAENARGLYNELSAESRDMLVGEPDNTVFIAPGGTAGKVVSVAMAQRGLPYVWGGESPSVGFDCSGLVLYAYASVGISLPHSSRAQYGYGEPVAFGQWQPGDLLFYGYSASSIHHVAMYIGGGQLVHASTFGVPVLTASAPYGAGNDYLGARRLIT